jgi:hypothetical protein
MKIIHKSKMSNFIIHVVNAKLLFAINHSIFKKNQKIKMDLNLNFVSFILLVKLKCNIDHIYGLN